MQESSVTEHQVTEYQAAGHLALRGALPRAEVEGVRTTVEALVREATRAALPLEERTPRSESSYGTKVLRRLLRH